MSDPLYWMTEHLATLSASHLRRSQREVVPLPEGKCLLSTSKEQSQLLWNFSTNDYLGLSGHERLTQAAHEAMQDSGVGSRASPVVTGRSHWHVKLEQRLARFKKTEAAILYPSGYAANVGTLTALMGDQDVVFCDRLCHASLIDGSRLSRAAFKVFPHNDVTALERELQKANTYRRCFIIVDSLFSMDGDAAPLQELSQLAKAYDAYLIVDEGHATGLFGERGTGLLETLNGSASDLSRVIPIGTLSKAVGAQGGFVTGSQTLIDFLWNTARTQMFSTSLAVPLCAASIAAIDLIEEEPHRREWILSTSASVQNSLREQGWNVPHHVIGPIIPVIIGDDAETMQLSTQLQQQGILVAGIRPPTVPKGTARLRISLSYAHSDEGVAALLHAMQQLASSRTS